MNRGLLRRLLYGLYLWLTWAAYKLFNKLILYRTEITITQRCTLKCEKCANLIPLFEKPETYDVETVKNEMKGLFDSVDKIVLLRILGGEPFIHKNIAEIVTCAANSQKVGKVEIVTNGTILPSDEVLKSFSNKKVIIVISDYAELSRHKNDIVKKCEELRVNCRICYNKLGDKWLDAGGLHKRDKTKKQLKKQLLSCAMMCRNVQNGRLYYCPRASFGSFLGVEGQENDSVDLLSKDVKEKRKRIFELNQKRLITACNYCDMGTKAMKQIEIARQIE